MGHGKRGVKNDGEKTKVKTKADWIYCRANLVFVCNACLWYFCTPIVEYAMEMERWPSGLRRTLGKRVYSRG